VALVECNCVHEFGFHSGCEPMRDKWGGMARARSSDVSTREFTKALSVEDVCCRELEV
jgi:hypothetical protein